MIGRIAGAVAVLLLGGAAVDQRPPVDRALDEARRAMRVYARCLVDRAEQPPKRAQLVAFLAVAPGSAEGERAARALIAPECLRGAATATQYVARLRFPPDLLRGELFRVLYLDLKQSPPRARVTRAEVAPGFALPAAELVTALQRFGDCVVASDPTDADLMVRQPPGSSTETRAIQALAPAMAPCLTEGRQWRFSRAVLAGVLAEGLYRRATAGQAR